MKKPFRFTLWIMAALCLVPYVALPGASAQQFVLCFEPDGCLELEAVDVGEGCCSCSDHGEGSANHETQDEESCSDIVLAQLVFKPKQGGGICPTCTLDPASPSPQTQMERPAPTPIATSDDPISSGRSEIIRTVVLLI